MFLENDSRQLRVQNFLPNDPQIERSRQTSRRMLKEFREHAANLLKLKNALKTNTLVCQICKQCGKSLPRKIAESGNCNGI